jgi:hypothetical protein
MRRIVLRHGLIAGAIMSVMFLIALPFHEAIGFEWGMVVGYSSMVLAFLMIHFGLRTYRDTVGGGRITFGQGVATGLLIVLVASLVYVAMWQIVYYNFLPDYMEKYAAYALEKARQGGATAEQLAAQQAEMAAFAESYRNPLVNAAYTILEPLPPGVVLTLLSSWILSRRRATDVRHPSPVAG